MPDTSDLLRAIEQATKDLSFPSESDVPIEPHTFGASEPSPEALVHTLGLPAETPVETTTPHSVFEGLTYAPKGASEDDIASAARFQGLLAILERDLSDLRAYRVGQTDITIFVLGHAPSGEWLGIKTKVVET